MNANVIDSFIEKLPEYCINSPNIENMYSDSFEFYEIARNNLRIYLKKMYKLKPEYLIVGEAPGHKGCRWSGVPFTSERNLKENNFFGLNNGFKIRNIKQPESEASATIVWNCLDELKKLPLIWNAFPFHPYIENNPNSNRAPTAEELRIGKIILEDLINIFHIEKINIIPIGQKAAKIIKDYGISTVIRHPSHGGKDEFISGMKAIFNS